MRTDGPWRRWVPSNERLHALRQRWQRVLVLSAATGIATGLAVVGFERLTRDVLLDRVLELPDPVLVLAPGFGLVVAWAALRWLGQRATPGVGDEYLRLYHGRPCRTDARAFASRVAASAATLGSGGAMGFEGPSIFLGASIGRWLQERYRRLFTHRDAHVLLVAGAAAGVAAIFKAPATGAVFALEVPYQQDTASHAVLPALIGAASSYLVFAAFNGTGRLLAIAGSPAIDARDLLGAIALGLLCGIGARGYARVLVAAKQLQRRLPAPRRLAIGGLGLALVATIAILVFDDSLTLGPGYRAIAWSLDPGRSVWLVALLFVLEAAATTCTITGGGAGGVFIPLVVEGWLLGRVFEGVLATQTSLFPVIGAAAFLGAGYRTPIAAVVFVAETTGRPGFIVPALVATAVAQLMMGRGMSSVTEYQLPRRLGALSRRLDQPVSVAVDEDVFVCSPDDRVADVLARMPAGAAMVAVVDNGRYVGMASPARAASGAAAEPIAAAVVDHVALAPEWQLRRAQAELRASGVEALPVVDAAGRFLGVVRASAILGDDVDDAD